MSDTEPTFKEAIVNKKLRPVLLAWGTRLYNDEQISFVYDVQDNKPARYLYDTYIAPTSPKLINLDAVKFLNPMRNRVAREGDAAYTQMRDELEKALNEMYTFLGQFYIQQKFLESPEWLKHLRGGVTYPPKVAEFIANLRLNAAKSKAIAPLLEVYGTARTATDAYQAYVAMQKIVAKAALDAALTTYGKPIGPVTAAYKIEKEEGNKAALALANAKKAAALVSSISKEVEEANDYLTTALKTAKDKAKMKTVSGAEVTRMFQSGRRRVEAASTSWTKAVRLDPKFSTKNSTLASNKKKMDEDWAEYRKALGK